MASRICLERLNKLEVAFQYAEEAAEAATDAHDVINAARGRLCMVRGVGVGVGGGGSG